VTATGRRLAILSFSYGEYDARSFRVASSAVAAGYQVTLYTRWSPGLPVEEARDGYRIVRVDSTWRLAVPWMRAKARARWTTCVAANVPTPGSPASTTGPAPKAAPPGRRGTRPGRVRRAKRKLGLWRSIFYTFPLRPMGWSVALEDACEPADIWHGMWAGSLPALVRLRRRHGGRTIYDSRDVYMLSREFYRLEWPFRPILAALERHWAHRVDRVVTVNEAYADLLVTQLGVPRPPVVMNTPERWTPPEPPPDLIREALGLAPATSVVLYQGQLNTERGIEEAADAVLEIPGAVLVLLGFGVREEHYRALTREPPYAGHVFHLPAVPPSELLAWTASSDVLVMAIQPTSVNHEFTTPQKLWEALAAGVPVVASDLPGMAEVVRETGAGYLCDPTSPTSIAAALRRVLEASPEERAVLRARALRAAHERYNWETQAKVLLGVYAGLLAGTSGGDRGAR
jgi:glycosyltransferase involved in cell wall biosynthesis